MACYIQVVAAVAVCGRGEAGRGGEGSGEAFLPAVVCGCWLACAICAACRHAARQSPCCAASPCWRKIRVSPSSPPFHPSSDPFLPPSSRHPPSMRLLSRECQATGQPRSHFPVPAWQRRQQQLHQGEKQQGEQQRGEQQQKEQQQEGGEEECVTNGNESHEAHQGAMAAGQDVGCGSTAARCNECSLEDHKESQIVISSSFPPLVFDLSSCELLLSHYSPLVHSPPALPGALSCSTLSRFPTTHPSAAPLQASVLRLTLTSAASASLCHAWNSTDASMFAANRWCKVKRRRVAWQSKHAEQGKAHTCCLGGMSLQACGDSRDTREGRRGKGGG